MSTHEWMYHIWSEVAADQREVPLKADDLIGTQSPPGAAASAGEWLHYAENAYLACRVLMLSSYVLHHDALYLAAQTLERGMKAVLVAQVASVDSRTLKRYGHRLPKLAKALNGDEFQDEEFLKICARLEPFAEAGRYPRTRLDSWRYSLELLTFLDGFMAHCSAIVGEQRAAASRVDEFLRLTQGENVVMTAAETAVRANNHYLREMTGDN